MKVRGLEKFRVGSHTDVNVDNKDLRGGGGLVEADRVRGSGPALGR